MTGSCTDNGCAGQWENRGSCVDFSNSVDFQHVGGTFNLSSGSKPGLCGHQSGKKDCCHCLQLINWDGDCVKFSSDPLSSVQSNIVLNTREHCIESCQTANYRFAGVRNGSTCWCGDEAPSQDDLRPGECNMPCPGNVNETCGAAYATNVFDIHCEDCLPTSTTTTTTTTTTAIGCPDLTAGAQTITCTCPSSGTLYSFRCHVPIPIPSPRILFRQQGQSHPTLKINYTVK